MEIYNRISPDAAYGSAIRGLEKEDAALDSESVFYNSTHDALLLTEALRVAQNTADLRREKIENIKRKIAAGTYEINSLRIAAALIREDMAMYG